MMKELIIIGAGPAGLSAAIYARRAGLDLTVFEKLSPGGQVINTFEVENYPGFENPIAGWELMSAMEAQARRLGVKIDTASAEKIIKTEDGIFRVSFSGGRVWEAKAVIIAAGASYRKLGVPGEKEYIGRGVSYCATCDAAFYRDMTVVVVGGGDTALEEALYLTRFASKIYLIHRRDQFRAGRILQDRVFASEKIIPVYDSIVESIAGGDKVSKVQIKNVRTSAVTGMDVNGVFIFIGIDPNTDFLDPVLLNGNREVMVDINMKTGIEGLWAAGDLRSDSKRQIITAAADGAAAAMDAYNYITGV